MGIGDGIHIPVKFFRVGGNHYRDPLVKTKPQKGGNPFINLVGVYRKAPGGKLRLGGENNLEKSGLYNLEPGKGLKDLSAQGLKKAKKEKQQ
jgi:hypothetical protein